jgi:pyruvate kinase
MKRVILYAQENNPVEVDYRQEEAGVQNAISRAVLQLAGNISAGAIVAETASGATALNIAALRPTIPVIAVTSDTRTAQLLALSYGTKSYVRPIDKFAATKLTNWLQKSRVLSKGDIIVTASGKYPGVVGTTDTIKVRVLE